MKKLTVALALMIGAVSTYATTTVSNLNYFVADKKFNINTNVGWSKATTEVGTTESDVDGLEFGLTGRYGISNATNIGFKVGYTQTEDDSNAETTGLNDIDLLYSWRFINDSDRQQDLNFTLSPKLGAKEEDGTETNGYRGSTLISVDWTMNSKINANTAWNLTAGVDYFTKEETENQTGTVTEELKSRTDLSVTAAVRHNTSEKMFFGGAFGVALLGDLEDEIGTTTVELDPAFNVEANIGFGLDTTSNIVATLGYGIASGEEVTSSTDIDLNATSVDVAYIREF